MKKLILGKIFFVFILLIFSTVFLYGDTFLEEYQGFWFSSYTYEVSETSNTESYLDPYIEIVSARIFGNRIEFFVGTCHTNGIFTGFTLVFVGKDYLGNFLHKIEIVGAVDHGAMKNHKSLMENYKKLQYVFLRKVVKEEDGKTYLNIAFFEKIPSGATTEDFFGKAEFKYSLEFKGK